MLLNCTLWKSTRDEYCITAQIIFNDETDQNVGDFLSKHQSLLNSDLVKTITLPSGVEIYTRTLHRYTNQIKSSLQIKEFLYGVTFYCSSTTIRKDLLQKLCRFAPKLDCHFHVTKIS